MITPLSRAWTQQDSFNIQQTHNAPLKISGYGVVNYYAFDWETLPDQRNVLDPERLNLYLNYAFDKRVSLKAEVEWEHGGTGSSLSFDPLEEFGEFEQEIEKGGAVKLEQLQLVFNMSNALRVRIGKMRVYMGLASTLDEPGQYFTTYRSEVENTLLPLGWYETGLELSGKLGASSELAYPHWAYKVYLVSGLDNSAFSSQNWIRRGYQSRFETVNADQLAMAIRLDYVPDKDKQIGFCFYTNNATGNRPKNDFTKPSWVSLGDVHLQWDARPMKLRAYGMLGNVQNSESLSSANRNLSNNLGVKRTPVAKMAAGAYVEVAYDLMHLFKTKENALYLFTRAEWYDSMWKTEGTVFNNPRYERKVFTAGLNYFIRQGIVFKLHSAWRSLGSGEKENTLGLGFGFDF